MTKLNRGPVAVRAAVAAVAVIAACGGGAVGSVAGAAPTSSPVSVTYLADLPGEPAGKPMTMAITTKDDEIVAYATNGTDDDAYFFGTRNGDGMHLMSIYGDTLTASFDGTGIDGQLTMNEGGSTPMGFAASRVQEPAGIYTAAVGATRVGYIVRPDRSAIGVMDNSAPGDHRVTDAIMAVEGAFKDGVRQMRLDRSAQAAPPLDTRTMEAVMGGQRFRAVPVTGDMIF